MTSRACKHWHTVSTDDKSWMHAFMHRFGGRPCIRNCESWQSEYLAHHRFIHDWTLGRFENSQKDPRVGFISDIAVYDEQIMATSIETGSICQFTSIGKLIRDHDYIIMAGLQKDTPEYEFHMEFYPDYKDTLDRERAFQDSRRHNYLQKRDWFMLQPILSYEVISIST